MKLLSSRASDTALTLNPKLKVFLANGDYDLATIHLAAEYMFDHLDRSAPAPADHSSELPGRAHGVSPRAIAPEAQGGFGSLLSRLPTAGSLNGGEMIAPLASVMI